MTAPRNGETGFWNRQASSARFSRPWVTANEEHDIVVIGGGFTGLWTALFLRRLSPNRTVTVIEANVVGYGASGRNGGWVSSLIPGNRAVFERVAGLKNTRLMQRVFIESVSEIADEFDALDIDAQRAEGGILTAANTEAAMTRARAKYHSDRQYGYRDNEVSVLDADSFKERINISTVFGGVEYRHGMAIQPAYAVLGLAGAVEDAGVKIYERSSVTRIISDDRQLIVKSPEGDFALKAETVLVCTEGYTSQLSCSRRIAPINSSLIVTNRLAESDWERIGWNDRQCLNDSAHTFIYSQRTADGRIAIGGRGSPYRFNSGTGGEGRTDESTIRALRLRLKQFFPELAFDVEHAWSGVLGVTRDWNGTVSYNPSSGFGASLGYAGHGVTAAYVGGQTLAELVSGVESVRTRLPWVGYHPPAWEPEPLRWLGIHGMYRLFGLADTAEEFTNASKTSLIARFGGRLAGLSE